MTYCKKGEQNKFIFDFNKTEDRFLKHNEWKTLFASISAYLECTPKKCAIWPWKRYNILHNCDMKSKRKQKLDSVVKFILTIFNVIKCRHHILVFKTVCMELYIYMYMFQMELINKMDWKSSRHSDMNVECATLCKGNFLKSLPMCSNALVITRSAWKSLWCVSYLKRRNFKWIAPQKKQNWRQTNCFQVILFYFNHFKLIPPKSRRNMLCHNSCCLNSWS